MRLPPTNNTGNFTDEGKLEANSSAEPDFYPEMLLPRYGNESSDTSPVCNPPCHVTEVCWGGYMIPQQEMLRHQYPQCLYRPWALAYKERKTCLPDPGQPGLTLADKDLCRNEISRSSKQACEEKSASWCMWVDDAPAWWLKMFLPRFMGGYRSAYRKSITENAVDFLKGLAGELRPANPTIYHVLNTHHGR